MKTIYINKDHLGGTLNILSEDKGVATFIKLTEDGLLSLFKEIKK